MLIRALVLMAPLAVAAPTAALAHATLTTSQPGEGARLAEAPAAVTLTFASDVRVVSLLLKHDSAADVPLPLPSPGFAPSISAPLPPLALSRIRWVDQRMRG